MRVARNRWRTVGVWPFPVCWRSMATKSWFGKHDSAWLQRLQSTPFQIPSCCPISFCPSQLTSRDHSPLIANFGSDVIILATPTAVYPCHLRSINPEERGLWTSSGLKAIVNVAKGNRREQSMRVDEIIARNCQPQPGT